MVRQILIFTMTSSLLCTHQSPILVNCQIFMYIVERTRCFDWATLGTCRFSTDCRFAHNSEARKEYCSDFLRGSCTRPNCKFFHEDPLANQPPQPLDIRGKARERDVAPRAHPPHDRVRTNRMNTKQAVNLSFEIKVIVEVSKWSYE